MRAVSGVQLGLSTIESDNGDFQRLDAIARESGLGFVQATVTLAERFGVPPFTILDARQGYWQTRKRAWISLGIQSELGRGEKANPGGSLRDAASLGPDGHTRRGDGRGKALAYHTAQSIIQNPAFSRKAADRRSKPILRSNTVSSSNAMEYAGGYENSPAGQSGTSIFDPVLCEMVYRWFCPPAGKVLDPFAGGSVRGVVAAYLGLEYTGIDLRPEQAAANEEQWGDILGRLAPSSLLNREEIVTQYPPPQWVVDDARNCNALPGGYDFIFTCPPYFNLEIYSDDPADLSNCQSYGDFLDSYWDIITKALAMLNNNRFACFVVGDLRDDKGLYRNLPGDTITAFAAGGGQLYNEAILVTSVGSLPIRVAGQFKGNRKLGKTHQNILVFWKGDPARIKDALGEIDTEVSLPAIDDPVAYRAGD